MRSSTGSRQRPAHPPARHAIAKRRRRQLSVRLVRRRQHLGGETNRIESNCLTRGAGEKKRIVIRVPTRRSHWVGLFSIWKTLGNSRGTERLVPPARTGDACPPWTPPMSCLPPPHRPTPIAFRAVTTSAPAATKSRLPLLRWRWLSPPLHLPPSIHDSLFLNSWYNSSLFSSPPRTGGRRGRVRAIGAASRPSTPWSPRPAPTTGRDRAHLLDQLQRSSCAPSSAILGSGRWPALCCEPREAVMPQATGGMYADAIDHSR